MYLHLEKYHRITINNRIYWLKDAETIPKDFEEYLCGKDGHLRYESGTTYLRSQPLLWDMTLYTPPAETTNAEVPQTTEEASTLQETATLPEAAPPAVTTIIQEPSESEEKRDIIMTLLGIILLATPGIISLLVSGDAKNFSKEKLPKLLANYLVYEFLTILLSYGIITILKGSVTVSFAGISRGEQYTIFYSNFVFRTAVLFLVCSVTLGLLKPYFLFWKDRILEKMPSPEQPDKHPAQTEMTSNKQNPEEK